MEHSIGQGKNNAQVNMHWIKLASLLGLGIGYPGMNYFLIGSC